MTLTSRPMPVFAAAAQQIREEMEAIDTNKGYVIITLKATFHLNHGDMEIIAEITDGDGTVKGYNLNALLTEWQHRKDHDAANAPLCLPRAGIRDEIPHG